MIDESVDIIKLIVSVAVPVLAGLGSSVLPSTPSQRGTPRSTSPGSIRRMRLSGRLDDSLYLMGLALFLIWRSHRTRTRTRDRSLR